MDTDDDNAADDDADIDDDYDNNCKSDPYMSPSYAGDTIKREYNSVTQQEKDCKENILRTAMVAILFGNKDKINNIIWLLKALFLTNLQKSECWTHFEQSFELNSDEYQII